MKTMILSKHEPTIMYIKKHLDIPENQIVVKETVDSSKIEDLTEENIGRVVGTAPLWLIREFNRHGIDYLDFSFRTKVPTLKVLSLAQLEAYEPVIEPFTVMGGTLDELAKMVQYSQNMPRKELVKQL